MVNAPAHLLLSFLLLLLLLVATAASSSVRVCDGKAECSRGWCTWGCRRLHSAVPELHRHMDASARNGYGDQFYFERQLIACMYDRERKGSFCAFYDNVYGGTLAAAAREMQTIVDHGCRLCGHVRVEGEMGRRKGLLRVEFVEGPTRRAVGCAGDDEDGMCLHNVTSDGSHW